MKFIIEEVEVNVFNWVAEDGTRSQDFDTWTECKNDAKNNA